MKIPRIEEIFSAQSRIQGVVLETPLIHSPSLSQQTGANIFLKLECLQPTGSFKVRGAFNKIIKTLEGTPCARFITASTGNHGAAVAYASTQTGMKSEVWVPKNIDRNKVERIEGFGGLVLHKSSPIEAIETQAREYSIKSEGEFISPYNDEAVICGQGTIGLEVMKSHSDVDVVIASLGGGGLSSGIGLACKGIKPSTKIIACSPKASMEMISSIKAGKIVPVKHYDTISDSTAGGIEKNSITFSACQRVIDEFVSVSEIEIEQALLAGIFEERIFMEGASAVTLAALKKIAPTVKGLKVVLIICGSNISRNQIALLYKKKLF